MFRINHLHEWLNRICGWDGKWVFNGKWNCGKMGCECKTCTWYVKNAHMYLLYTYNIFESSQKKNKVVSPHYLEATCNITAMNK